MATTTYATWSNSKFQVYWNFQVSLPKQEQTVLIKLDPCSDAEGRTYAEVTERCSCVVAASLIADKEAFGEQQAAELTVYLNRFLEDVDFAYSKEALSN